MTVYIEKPAVNLREELASLRNQGNYSEQQFYFDGLVTNGTFDSATTGWTATNGSTAVSSGQVTLTNTASIARLSQPITTVVGQKYFLSGDLVSNPNAGAWLIAGTTVGGFNLGTVQNATGAGPKTNTLMFIASGTTTHIGFLNNSNTVGYASTWDNISVFEVDANDDVIHTLPKGWVPKDVFEDGLLQREGAAHDYTVVYDGFDYKIKPAVAPSATTQTCVIGVNA